MPQIPEPINTSRLLAERIERAVRRKLNLTGEQCYVSAASAYIDGQPPLVVQVVPGEEKSEGGGAGAQDGGGALLRRQSYQLVTWFRVKTDPHGHSREALVAAGTSLLEHTERLRRIFAMTFLGDGVTFEPVRWEGSTVTTWFDQDRGILTRTVTISAPYATPLPDAVTLDETDFL